MVIGFIGAGLFTGWLFFVPKVNADNSKNKYYIYLNQEEVDIFLE